MLIFSYLGSLLNLKKLNIGKENNSSLVCYVHSMMVATIFQYIYHLLNLNEDLFHSFQEMVGILIALNSFLEAPNLKWNDSITSEGKNLSAYLQSGKNRFTAFFSNLPQVNLLHLQSIFQDLMDLEIDHHQVIFPLQILQKAAHLEKKVAE